ncbi:alpha-D-ribose 1-methylphosphonate 5-triphosphate synthase subunit PhnL [Roseovarius sp. MBR-79]|jgi:alpha-D-ribose 1-methylphosphonate 5-triphosphate synthase subunit PhnL
MTQPILEIDNLSKTFVLHLLGAKRIEALKDVSFTLGRGEFLAVTGRTGAGKSTLVKTVLQYHRPTGGGVVYHRTDGTALRLDQLPVIELIALLDSEIGYVAQHLHVVPRVAALDLMIEAAPHHDRPRAEAEARALFEALRLPESHGELYPATFSGGEKQRFNLGLTLMRRPRLLIVDEPTAALDPETREIVIDLMASLKAQGTSTIAVLHDRLAVERLADREIVIAAGQLAAEHRVTQTEEPVA